jgi:hypothetical protein
MLNRDLERERPRSRARRQWRAAAPTLSREGLSALRRAYRWLNLTLVHQGVWPLLLVVFNAPQTPVALTPLPWYWVRLGAPLLAAALAFAYLAQRVASFASDEPPPEQADDERHRPLRQQVTMLVVGVAAAVAVLRVLQGPASAVLKLEAFGLVDVAAYQAINFGVAGRALPPGPAQALPIALFGLSWGVHDLLLAAASPVGSNLALVFAGGAAIGLAAGAVCWLLRRWPGGYLAASAMQFLIVYLVAGFLG